MLAVGCRRFVVVLYFAVCWWLLMVFIVGSGSDTVVDPLVLSLPLCLSVVVLCGGVALIAVGAVRFGDAAV